MKRLKSQGFTIALIAAVLLGFLIPNAGASGGALRTEFTSKLCVALAFFLQGLSLHGRQLIKSSVNARLHIFCQSWVFILSPVLMLIILSIFGNWLHPGLRNGLIYLAVLPTTIASSTVLTSNCNGDTGSALFNATFSNIIGVFITPIWCLALFAESSGNFPPMGSLVLKISLLVLAPLAVGQAIRPIAREWADRNQKWFKRINNGLIAFVVYAAFSNSAKEGIWQSFSWQSIAICLAFTIVFLLLMSSLVWTSSDVATSHYRQRIAAFFCGSQKSLAAGVPMAAIIFANQSSSTQASLIILPIMLYHSLQLFLAGAISPTLAKNAKLSHHE